MKDGRKFTYIRLKNVIWKIEIAFQIITY